MGNFLGHHQFVVDNCDTFLLKEEISFQSTINIELKASEVNQHLKEDQNFVFLKKSEVSCDFYEQIDQNLCASLNFVLIHRLWEKALGITWCSCLAIF